METLKEKYLKSNGVKCPYCDSGDLHTGDHEFNDGGGYENVMCHNCLKEWTDIYTLTDVSFEE
jgi:hypothetical protein